MSALGLPSLRRNIVAHYRTRKWAQWRQRAVRAAAWSCFGVAIGFNVEPVGRALLEGPRQTVHATAEERRALDRLRTVGVQLISDFSSEELRARLITSKEALALAAHFDTLPDPQAAGSRRWLVGSSPGRLGRSEAIAILGQFVAEQPPARRGEIAALLSELAVALPISIEFVRWVAELPEDARSPVQLVSLRRLATLPKAWIERLATISIAYTGPGNPYRDAPPPYPCIDPASNTRWWRGATPLFTCTVAIQ